ncbi:MAG: HAD family hydrolase [Candidatus Omnitrophica bacterium]|nr:HAD family hydrolase [Candidatus Omnitrophota bacterium]
MKTKTIKAVIFDLDGTLVNAYKAVFQSINFALKSSGFPVVSAQTVKRSVGWGDRQLIEQFVGKAHAPQVLELYREHHKESLPKGVTFLPGAKKLLEDLDQQGYILAIATNRPERFTKIILDVLDIQSHFDYVLCADQIKRPKPYPDILKLILKKYQLSVHEALYVGDMTIDVQTGNSARVKTAAVLTGSSTSGEISVLKPFAIISRISHVKKLIQTIDSKQTKGRKS